MPRKSKKGHGAGKKRRGGSKRAALAASGLTAVKLSAKRFPRRKGKSQVDDPLACFSEQTGATFG